MRLMLALTASLCGLLATATPIAKRAGGPLFNQIPANCTITNPLPHASDSYALGTIQISGYKPCANFTSAHQLYASYFNPTFNQTATATQCLESCYGYGNPGQCKAAVTAYQVPTPKGYFGTAGGVLETACLLFDAYLTPLDFEATITGQWVNETAGNIYCPS